MVVYHPHVFVALCRWANSTLRTAATINTSSINLGLTVVLRQHLHGSHTGFLVAVVMGVLAVVRRLGTSAHCLLIPIGQ